MRYMQPEITGKFYAVSTVSSDKLGPNSEIGYTFLTSGNAYQGHE